MTLTEAFIELNPPLHFGDARQIEAVRLIETIEACVDAIKSCTHQLEQECVECGGEGKVPCECHCGDEHTQECPMCEGDGVSVVSCCEHCLKPFGKPAKEMALAVIEHGWSRYKGLLK
jgi:hypothetical protein